jgi:hypothetical protein
MKNLLIAVWGTLLIATACVFTSCENNGLSANYPQIQTVNRLLSGSWAVTARIDSEGTSVQDNGTVYNFQVIADYEDSYTGGLLSISEEGQVGYSGAFQFEPILQGDLDGSESEKSVAVEIYFGNNHYMISRLSESTMKWQVISFDHGQVIISKAGLVFNKVQE